MKYEDHYDKLINAIREFLEWCDKYSDLTDKNTKGLYADLKIALKRYLRSRVKANEQRESL